ncbi:MAG: hypothetical protein IT228_06630 [Flavobacteriales bacterium]|nr:hypothetical protein [Flavobacteriales bacterium]NUQ15371.1 hypothetical protein [Flavobacteriales bacterium]
MGVSLHRWPVLAFACMALPLGLDAQTLCSAQGNVILYSNYDGGPLVIAVDEDIPDLHVGIVSYEYVKVEFIGAFTGNVTQVVYAGMNGSNDHCGIGSGTSVSINGAPNATTDIRVAPPVTFANGNGYGSMICAYSCDVNTGQGGCNTADQVAHYFLTEFGGILRYHRTQYGCWSGTQYVSAAGNCCEDPLATLLPDHAEPLPLQRMGDRFVLEGVDGVRVVDASGRVVLERTASGGRVVFEVTGWSPGSYIVMEAAGERVLRFAVMP